jgi:hypothetical protein
MLGAPFLMRKTKQLGFSIRWREKNSEFFSNFVYAMAQPGRAGIKQEKAFRIRILRIARIKNLIAESGRFGKSGYHQKSLLFFSKKSLVTD